MCSRLRDRRIGQVGGEEGKQVIMVNLNTIEVRPSDGNIPGMNCLISSQNCIGSFSCYLLRIYDVRKDKLNT